MIVLKPLYSQVYCSSRNEKKALIIIFLVSILSIIPYYHYHNHANALDVLKVISAILSLLGPWVICVILWILLLRIVNREIGSMKLKQFTLHAEIVAQRLKSKSKITKMVLIICFFNIISQLPVLLLTIFGLTNYNPCGHLLPIFFVGLLFVSNLLLIVNHSVNFFIYSLTNCKFRYTLKVMCRHCYFFYDRQLTKRQKMIILNYDDHRKTPYQQAKYDHKNAGTNGKINDSPRLLITTRSKNISNQNQKKSRRVDL